MIGQEKFLSKFFTLNTIFQVYFSAEAMQYAQPLAVVRPMPAPEQLIHTPGYLQLNISLNLRSGKNFWPVDCHKIVLKEFFIIYGLNTYELLYRHSTAEYVAKRTEQ